MSHDPDADNAVPADASTEDAPAPRPRRRRAPAKVVVAEDAPANETVQSVAPAAETEPAAMAEPADGAPAESSEGGAASQRPRRKRRRALEHRDWHLGKAQADAFAAERAAGARQADAARVTLGSLFDIYDREVTPEKTPQTQKHDRAAV